MAEEFSISIPYPLESSREKEVKLITVSTQLIAHLQYQYTRCAYDYDETSLY